MVPSAQDSFYINDSAAPATILILNKQFCNTIFSRSSFVTDGSEILIEALKCQVMLQRSDLESDSFGLNEHVSKLLNEKVWNKTKLILKQLNDDIKTVSLSSKLKWDTTPQ